MSYLKFINNDLFHECVELLGDHTLQDFTHAFFHQFLRDVVVDLPDFLCAGVVMLFQEGVIFLAVLAYFEILDFTEALELVLACSGVVCFDVLRFWHSAQHNLLFLICFFLFFGKIIFINDHLCVHRQARWLFFEWVYIGASFWH